MPTIEVCQAGTCRAAGGEAVLKEIEELADGTGCSVNPTGCVGACNQAPNAVLVQRGQEYLQTKIDTVEKSAALVEKACGVKPNLDDPALRQRLTAARRMRMRQQAREEKKWNAALDNMAQEVANADDDDKLEMQFEFAQLLSSAGQLEQALDLLVQVKAVTNHPQVIMNYGEVLGKLGNLEALEALQAEAEEIRSHWRAEVTRELRKFSTDAAKAAQQHNGVVPRKIEGYAPWTLTEVTPVSVHSANYRFTCSDRARGTPYLRGRGRTMWHKTWHTTMLAEVGANSEGPLSFIERDYTPVSTWIDWEKGQCDILIKVYNDGAATSWLHKQAIGAKVWLSQPHKTMHVPSLALDNGTSVSTTKLRSNGVLLVLGGTGIVAAAQVLQHADPTTCFGTSASRTPPLMVPISLVYACRQDDVLMAPEMAKWCAALAPSARLHRCVLAVSSPAQAATDELQVAAPFASYEPPADAPSAEAALAALPNYKRVDHRVTSELLQAELTELQSQRGGPIRVVVSGPAGFNGAVKEMLSQFGYDTEMVTILSA